MIAPAALLPARPMPPVMPPVMSSADRIRAEADRRVRSWDDDPGRASIAPSRAEGEAPTTLEEHMAYWKDNSHYVFDGDGLSVIRGSRSNIVESNNENARKLAALDLSALDTSSKDARREIENIVLQVKHRVHANSQMLVQHSRRKSNRSPRSRKPTR